MSNAPKLRTGRKSFWNPEKIAQLLTLRGDGKSNVEIGREFGVTEGCINRKCAELRGAGIKLPKRPTGSPAGNTFATYRSQKDRDTDHTRGAETRAQVQARAQALMRYWHRRGATHVTAWVEAAGNDRGGAMIFSLRSNLVNGLPPKQHPAIKSPNQANAAE